MKLQWQVRKKPKKTGDQNTEPPIIPTGTPELFAIRALADGKAHVAGTSHLKDLVKDGKKVLGRIWAANIIFGTSKANWRKRHHPADFDFRKSGSITHSGAILNVVSANELEFEATSGDLSITLSGFDPNRDVFVDVQEVKEPTQ